MRWTARAAVAALGVVAIAVAVAGEATAQTAAKHVTVARHAAHSTAGKRPPGAALPATLPPKYTIASDSFTSDSGTQTRGSVSCPAKTVPYGGGAVVESLDTRINLNSSFPLGASWDVAVNNTSGGSSTFLVYAVCAKKNTSYSIVASSPVADPAGSQAGAIATCPAGTKIMGGGGYSNSGDSSVNLNSLYPAKTGKGTSATYSWAAYMNNASIASTTVTAYAVCGHLAGYAMVVGNPAANPAGSQTLAAVGCPVGKEPIGGGGLSSSGSISVDLNSTAPNGNTWNVYEDNNSATNALITAFAICAGT
jgi:hypothetical protein